MHRILLAVVAVFLMTTQVLAAPADDTRTLLQGSGMEFEEIKPGKFKMLIKFTDGRSHVVLCTPVGGLRDMDVLEIYSFVLPIGTEQAPAALANRLLRASGSQKLGYFGIEDVEEKPWVFAYHNVPVASLTPTSLKSILTTVAEIADEMEKEQLGASSDEY